MPECAARTRKQGGRSRALWVDRHAERTLRPVTGQCRKQGHGAKPGEVQQTARPREQRTHQDFDSQAIVTCLYSQAFRMRLTSGRAKRQALSTPSTSEPALQAAFRYLSLIIQTIQSFTPARKSDYNNGATLNRAGVCVHVFSIDFAIWQGRWRRPCVKYRFNSYTAEV